MNRPPARYAAHVIVLVLALATAAGAKGPTPAPAKPGAAPQAAAKGAGGLGGLGDFSLTSNKEPVEITSEKLDFDYKAKRVVFTGNVIVVQGAVNLQTDTLTVDYTQVGEKQELKQANAEGHVVITQGPKKASGQHATFDQSNRTMVLTGEAVLEEGSNQVNGDRIVVHPDDSRMEVIGQNRRVKVVLFPGQGPLAEGADKKATPAAGAKAPAPAATPEAQANGSGQSS